MTFLSYAQNFEDVMLNRALRGVDRGFYIDVGAQHPTNDSVTAAFYQRGWHGINIDPVPQWAELLRTERPHDINLQLALGAEGGHKLMFAVADTGLSTDNEAFVQRHLDAGYKAEILEVDVSTLDEICERHHVSTVHFLKIDVEGAETDVIRGFAFDRVRPWIVLVEAIEPVTVSDSIDSVASHHAWEPILLARGYEFVYDDGLNRFYLAQEKLELREHFVLPPNPLDGFMRYQEWIKHERIVQLDGELQTLINVRDLSASNTELKVLQERFRKDQREHQDLLHDSANRLQRISVLEQETAALQSAAALHRAELEALASDSANRIEGIAILERENAVLLAVDAQRKADFEKLENNHRDLQREYEFGGSSRAGQLQRAAVLEQQLLEERNRYVALIERCKQLEVKVHAILHSSSWRLTRPIRWLRRATIGYASAAKPGPIASPIERVAASANESATRSLWRLAARRYLLLIARLGFKYPAVRRSVRAVVSLSPRTRSRLELFINNNRQLVGLSSTPADQSVNLPAYMQMLAPTEVSVVHWRMTAAMARTQAQSHHKGGANTGKSA